jgi:hypothetical protein
MRSGGPALSAAATCSAEFCSGGGNFARKQRAARRGGNGAGFAGRERIEQDRAAAAR